MTGRHGSAMSAADGVFTVKGLEEGTYEVRASKTGFAGASSSVELAGVSVRDLELRMSGGGDLVGRILGLDFDTLGQVEIMALQPTGSSSMVAGSVDYEGGYRIEKLAAGAWMVMAHGGGRSMQKSVTVIEGSEVTLDLDFGGGNTVSGSVLRDGVGLAGNRSMRKGSIAALRQAA